MTKPLLAGILFAVLLLAAFFSVHVVSHSAVTSPPVQPYAPTRHVLFISSYSESFETVDLQKKGIHEVFDANNVQLDIEYMDMKRHNTAENEANFYTMLRYKLRHRYPYDAVLLGDDVVYNPAKPALRQLMEVYEQTGLSVLGCQKVRPEQVSSYGIVAGTSEADPRLMRVTDMVEKPALEEAPSRLAVLGRYIITPEIFELLEHTAPGKGGEVQLTDALRVLAQQEAVYAYDFEGMRYDLGNKLGFLKATIDFALRREELHGPVAEYIKGLAGRL